MYNEKIRFRFSENVLNSVRLNYLAELFTKLESQNKEIASGGVPSYKISHNGEVVMHSFYPGSTNIIQEFIKSKAAESILK